MVAVSAHADREQGRYDGSDEVQQWVDADYPVVWVHTGVQWVSTPRPLQSGDGLGLTGNTSADAFGESSHFTWAFNFSPLN